MQAGAEPQHDLSSKAAHELSPETRKELAWVAASAWGADHALERVLQRLGRSGGESTV
jgi:putative GTP pyrophosphokinase